MLVSRRNFVVLYFPLILIIAIGHSRARELRPSDHGLEYQSSAEGGGKSPDLASFFSGSSPPPDLPLPEAKNTSDPSWLWGSGGGGGGGARGGGGGDHVRGVLLVASLVCGIAGGVLLVTAALLFIFQMRRTRASSAAK